MFSRPNLFRLTLLVCTSYVLYLAFQNQLNLYIHPRYIVFTTTMSAIALIVIVMDYYFTTKKSQHKHSSDYATLPLFIVIVFALFLPARTLTSATFTQRSTDAGSIISTTDSQPLSSLFSGSSRGLKMIDWTRLLSNNPDPNYYVNKPAKISGFVYDPGLGNNTFLLSRFVLTCCAVDAQPIGVPVQAESWSNEYDEDEWLEVEGEFRLADTAEGEQLVIIPDSITRINQPENPYAN